MQGSFDVSFEIKKPIQNVMLVNLLTDCDKLLGRTSAYEVNINDNRVTYSEVFEDLAIGGFIFINGYCDPEDAQEICHALDDTADSYGLECDYSYDSEIYSDAELNRGWEKW